MQGLQTWLINMLVKCTGPFWQFDFIKGLLINNLPLKSSGPHWQDTFEMIRTSLAISF
jgi:hypothetical protein